MKGRNKAYYMFNHIPESAAGTRSILATTTLLGKHILIVWLNCCSECSHDNEKEGKELGKVRGRQKKVNKNCWEERRWGRDVPSTPPVLSGWFSWAWDVPRGSSFQGSFLSNCSSCSSPLCLGRTHWDMESSSPSPAPAAPTRITHTENNQLPPCCIYTLTFSCHAQNPQCLSLKSPGCTVRVRCYPWKNAKALQSSAQNQSTTNKKN